jgi:2-phosphosulfolactate phosphatase
MRLDVALTPQQADTFDDAVCIMVDVLRASTTIVTLLERGVARLWVTGTVEKARRLAVDGDRLLMGERDGLPLPGFDFGNSPTALRSVDLAGREAVLTTSNGTAALCRLVDARAVFVGCLRNATACCRRALALAQESGAPLGIACAGRHRRFVLDDAVCAGALVDLLTQRAQTDGIALSLTDGAVAARQLWASYPDPLVPFRISNSGQRLQEIDAAADIAFCAQRDAAELVPRLGKGPLRLAC